jgi:hypothetical protein
VSDEGDGGRRRVIAAAADAAAQSSSQVPQLLSKGPSPLLAKELAQVPLQQARLPVTLSLSQLRLFANSISHLLRSIESASQSRRPAEWSSQSLCIAVGSATQLSLLS